jgi:hypothetical protein
MPALPAALHLMQQNTGMKKWILTGCLLYAINGMQAQQSATRHTQQYADITATAGQSQGAVAGSYVYSWLAGKKRKWEAGLGLRYTAYAGVKKDFITAPARLARTHTTPFLIVFAGQQTANWDTLSVQRPFVNSLNLSANLGYHFSAKWSAGFNIDLIGFSFGRKTSGILSSNGVTRTDAAVKPAAFNVLLTGDHDYGSLNSEFFLRYKLTPQWGIKAVYQFYFAEYKTTMLVQTAPDGTSVDRFRNKANMLGLGCSYYFKK